MVMDAGKHRSWEFLSMAFDELSNLIESTKLHPQLQSWLAENIANSFAEAFLSSASDVQLNKKPINNNQILTMYQDSESEVVLDIYGILTGHNLQEIHSSLVQTPLSSSGENLNSFKSLSGNVACCLCPLFRFMQTCEKINNCGSLADIDAVLECGVILPSTYPASNNGLEMYQNLPEDYVDNISQHHSSFQTIVCTSLFLVGNWLRELINAFCSQPDEDLLAKCLLRLNQLAKIENSISSITSKIQFDPQELGVATPIGNISSKSIISFQDSYKSSNENYQVSINDIQAEKSITNGSNLDQIISKPNKSRKRVSGGGSSSGSNIWKRYRRELNTSVYGFISSSSLQPDFSQNSNESPSMKISAEALVLILNELYLFAHSDKLGSISMDSEKINTWISDLVIGLMSHLKAVIGFENADESDIIEYTNKDEIIKIILQLLMSFIGSDFSSHLTKISHSNSKVVLKGILIHSKTADLATIESLSVEVLAIRAFDYLFQFTEYFEANSNAIQLIQFLETILSLSNSKSISEIFDNLSGVDKSYIDAKKNLGQVSRQYLKARGSSLLKSEVEFLIQLFIESDINCPYIIIDTLVNDVLENYGEVNSDNDSYYFTLTDDTVAIYLKVSLNNIYT
ncbi:Fanconi anemia group D2 protein-like protein [Smittium culicis]|uniref:Fanconi anemia group D2 protein-like protein n=1 Tax=Smittium culicis TaxID=133412 RepID=A0A1R1Y8M7_9FUNG|nr:Fanconi anemia group D2 protein-like protein [Smittium culicis]